MNTEKLLDEIDDLIYKVNELKGKPQSCGELPSFHLHHYWEIGGWSAEIFLPIYFKEKLEKGEPASMTIDCGNSDKDFYTLQECLEETKKELEKLI